MIARALWCCTMSWSWLGLGESQLSPQPTRRMFVEVGWTDDCVRNDSGRCLLPLHAIELVSINPRPFYPRRNWFDTALELTLLMSCTFGFPRSLLLGRRATHIAFFAISSDFVEPQKMIFLCVESQEWFLVSLCTFWRCEKQEGEKKNPKIYPIEIKRSSNSSADDTCRVMEKASFSHRKSSYSAGMVRLNTPNSRPQHTRAAAATRFNFFSSFRGQRGERTFRGSVVLCKANVCDKCHQRLAV